MKKMIIFMGIVLIVFGLLVYIVPDNDKEASVNNPNKNDEMNTSTINQLSDTLYSNQIILKDLKESLSNGENLFVYFYSPYCSHCIKATPVIVPIAESMNINLKKLNLFEFDEGWEEFNIEGTPTIIQYVNGKEVSRIFGAGQEEDYRGFFTNKVE